MSIFQSITTGILYTPPSAVTYDATVQLWADSMSATPTTTLMQALSDCVTNLKSDGIWTKFDRFFLLACNDKQQALRCVATLNDASLVGSPTFSANTGFVNMSTSNYINSNYDSATSSTGLTQNSAHIGMYITNDTVTGSHPQADIGHENICISANRSASLGPMHKINSSTIVNVATVYSTIGHWTNTKTATTQISLWREATLINTATVDSWTMSSRDFYIGTDNVTTGPAGSTDRSMSLGYWGAGLSGAECATLDTRIQTLRTALGF